MNAHTTTRTADAIDLDTATRAGQRAYLLGASMAPSSSRVIRDLIGSAPVGEPRTLEIFRAFSRGYARQATIAADAILAQ